MKPAKTELLPDNQLWEKCFAPKCPNEPMIRVLKNVERERFEGEFSINCEGVLSSAAAEQQKCQNENIKDSSDLYRNLLSSCLSKHQMLDFVYDAVRNDKGDVRSHLKVIGHSVGVTCDEAKESARRLWQNLAVVLNTTNHEYCFRPVTERKRVETELIVGRFEEVLKPASFSVEATERGQLGFAAKVSPGKRIGKILVPYISQREIKRHFDSSTSSMSCYPTDVKIVISLRPMGLSNDEVQKITAALKKLDTLSVNRLNSRDETVGCIEDEGLIDAIRQHLSLWVAHTSGLRISCTVSSDERLPSSLLAMIGNDIYGGYIMTCNYGIGSIQGSILPEACCDSSDKHVLDLRDCINGSAPLPPLFPSAKALLECGMKKVYQTGGSDLPHSGIVLGQVYKGGVAREVRFGRHDRSRHGLVIGATGTGKSELLLQMLKQDIENGEGVCLLDPHGDLYSQVLRSIPKERVDDVILIDPCDFDNAVGINFLECGGRYKSMQMNFISNEMMKIFDRLYDLKQTGGPMFEQYMRNALVLLMDNEIQGATLMDIPLLFEDSDYRTILKKNCKSQAVVSFWHRQAERAGGEASLENMVPYITSKLNQFTNNALLRPIIGQPKSTIDFRHAMDSGKIILVNLSRGLLGELDSQLLSMLILGKLFGAAMSRVNLRQEERRPMFLCIDEFHTVTTDKIGHMLSEARKYGLYLTLANQHMSQLSAIGNTQNMRDAVLGNVSSIFMMRMGAADAEKLEVYVKPGLTSQDLQELPDFHVAGRILNNNRVGKPLVFRTLPAIISNDNGNAQKIIQLSRSKYTNPVVKVEADIEARRNAHKKEEII